MSTILGDVIEVLEADERLGSDLPDQPPTADGLSLERERLSLGSSTSANSTLVDASRNRCNQANGLSP
jgi:hypothetical protein